MKTKIRDLGWANGWQKDPAIVVRCVKAGHVTTSKDVRRWETVVTCQKCGYEYRMDGSN